MSSFKVRADVQYILKTEEGGYSSFDYLYNLVIIIFVTWCVTSRILIVASLNRIVRLSDCRVTCQDSGFIVVNGCPCSSRIHRHSVPCSLLYHPYCVLHHWTLWGSEGWSDDLLNTECSTRCLSTESFDAGIDAIPIFVSYPYVSDTAAVYRV